MKTPNWLVSKGLFYGLVFIFLFFMLWNVLPSALSGNDLAANFLAELFGLAFTVGILAIIFDLREWVEWKSVEDRVKKRIGIITRTTFDTLSMVCRVERVHYEPRSKEKQIGLVERQLNTLVSKEIRFTRLAEKNLLDQNIRTSLRKILDSRANRLGKIEERYSKFLSSEVRASLMDVQEYLDKLSLEFSVPHMRNEVYFESVRELIKKLMVEIKKLKRKGFWVDW